MKAIMKQTLRVREKLNFLRSNSQEGTYALKFAKYLLRKMKQGQYLIEI